MRLAGVVPEEASAGRRRDRDGRIELRFARGPDGSTHVERQLASYPFHLCRALRLPGDPDGMATLYLQSCAGGLFEHDRLSVSIVAGEGTHEDLDTLLEIGENMTGKTICVLSDSCATPVASGIQKFRADFEALIKKKKHHLVPAAVA